MSLCLVVVVAVKVVRQILELVLVVVLVG